MSLDIKEACLMKYLKSKNPRYFGKVLDLREKIEDWLSYIPQSFPHYTRHTVKHSDEIIVQLSKLLFIDDDIKRPTVRLSSAEAYILIVAAYLHDAGMVVSDREKTDILGSDDWKTYISEGKPGEKRWKAIQNFRHGSRPPDEAQRNFIADVQTRFLLSEFIRRIHHERVSKLITQNEIGLAGCSFGDPSLKNTLINVCVAHGLEQTELLDQEKFPDRRDIRGETVNIRFLALLVRIGDLLDTSNDRACPLLLNTVCPIPADSLAQWTRYQRITHRLTAYDRIELTALCKNQEEHRFLQDWCNWLVEELKGAGTIMSRSSRHGDWKPPYASLDGETPTLIIKPDFDATYVPSKWKIELDNDIIVQRLIKDVHVHPLSFIRELIQNALDANRCQMYLDIIKEGKVPPDFPTQTSEDRRGRYPVEISLGSERSVNDLSGEFEDRQVLIVEDFGMGMDQYIIENYFLQVGRSFYTTDEFYRRFGFTPSSRFGVGFLSVFNVTDHVEIETLMPSSPSGEKPLHLVLKGPRNYLLLEKGSRRIAGTQIRILLRKPLGPGVLRSYLAGICRKVEFPVIVRDLDQEITIMAESPSEFMYETPVLTEEGSFFEVQSFPIDCNGIEGEIYIFSTVTKEGERWDRRSWAVYTYAKSHLLARELVMPSRIICLNGIALSDLGPSHEAYSFRLDLRKTIPSLPLDRHYYPFIGMIQQDFPEIISNLERIVIGHLERSPIAKSKDGWKYRNSLAEPFSILSSLWRREKMIPIFEAGKSSLVSLDDIASKPILTMIIDPSFVANETLVNKERSVCNETKATITYENLLFVDEHIAVRVFDVRIPVSFGRMPNGCLVVDWTKCDGKEELELGYRKATLQSLGSSKIAAVYVEKIKEVLLNTNNDFVKWLLRAQEACKQKLNGLTYSQFVTIFNAFFRLVGFASMLDLAPFYKDSWIEEFEVLLGEWKSIPGLEPELLPPQITRDMILKVSKTYTQRARYELAS